ncbi:hypothetical protein DMB65_09645 [Flavobacterium cheongpyeongense]|uniref:Prevent-host-death protein n=1 Tax=Flavobacterium cheongpyeongense TaxID=2212651 RepID=A0A2V4BPA1_9FLAO|nr:hypothetical protein [Flavobacterium cheongpyeongense]PXY40836.1 hypothetical protein DMB65_09645 [Flavobacterium cheongpyeongense]
MSTLELKQELHQLINEGDEKFVKMFYEMAKAYSVQIKKDKMIAESEEDIKAGKIYSQIEVQKMIESWKE